MHTPYVGCPCSQTEYVETRPSISFKFQESNKKIFGDVYNKKLHLPAVSLCDREPDWVKVNTRAAETAAKMDCAKIKKDDASSNFSAASPNLAWWWWGRQKVKRASKKRASAR